MNAQIDPSARVHASARLGPGVVIGAEAEVGPDCRLEAFAVIGPHTHLGPGCRVHSFAVIGASAQDRRTDPDAPHRLICGAGNIFREHVTVSRGTAHGGGETRLGADNLLMAHSHVGHDCRLGDGNTLANGVSLAGHVMLGDGVILGGHAAVHQFARLGHLAFIAANAMVSRDVPPYCLAAGDRATLRGLNTTGLRRADMPAETRRALRRAFRALFVGSGLKEAAATLLDHPDAAVRALAEFVLDSPRGIARWRGARDATPSDEGPADSG